MKPEIRSLPADTVNLMAAGEVIDSLAAVVRELAENALDAGATRITISLWPDQWQIRVADNGSGMDIADLQRAALPHNTNKIRTTSDLWQITSLGFRGEALHSLAQLAALEIRSRPIAADSGWCITYSPHGQPDAPTPIALSPGTIVTVSQLFGNWLPRRQGLPSVALQLRAVQTTIQHLALCHPQVTWQVQQADRPWFAIWGHVSAQQIVPQLLRDVQPPDLQEYTVSFPEAASLYLLLGLPDRCHRHRPDWIKVAVNGRMVRMPELEQTILGAFRRTLPRDRYPVCLLHLHLPPAQVDWNRHPAKAELYLHSLKTWQSHVEAAIDQALHLHPATLGERAQQNRVSQLIKTAEQTGQYAGAKTTEGIPTRAEAIDGDGPSNSIDLESEPSLPAGPRRSIASLDATALIDLDKVALLIDHPALSPLKAVAQVHQMYILAEHPDGLWLVEQHIAHERVLYEALADRWHLVSLPSPLILEHLAPAQVEQLQRLTIDIDGFGEHLWAIRSAPAVLAGRSDCADALVELSLGGDLEAALVATACRTAIRNGAPLSLTAMQTLLDCWQQTRTPRTCPHGRPIYLPLEESSLSRFFRRHWVIGKSHGI